MSVTAAAYPPAWKWPMRNKFAWPCALILIFMNHTPRCSSHRSMLHLHAIIIMCLSLCLSVCLSVCLPVRRLSLFAPWQGLINTLNKGWLTPHSALNQAPLAMHVYCFRLPRLPLCDWVLIITKFLLVKEHDEGSWCKGVTDTYSVLTPIGIYSVLTHMGQGKNLLYQTPISDLHIGFPLIIPKSYMAKKSLVQVWNRK
jgi:hypothetical protein